MYCGKRHDIDNLMANMTRSVGVFCASIASCRSAMSGVVSDGMDMSRITEEINETVNRSMLKEKLIRIEQRPADVFQRRSGIAARLAVFHRCR